MDEFKKIVSVIHYYYSESIKDSVNRNKQFSIKCDFSTTNKALSISTFSQLETLKLDDNYTNLRLTYYANEQSISEVLIDMNQSSRSISVSGLDEVKVEALYREINSRLETKTTLLSWINWSITIIFILFVTSWIAIITLAVFTRKIISGDRSPALIVYVILLIIYTVSILLFVFSPIKIADLIPNFLITPDSISWWDKNSGLIGFIGFMMTVITVLFNFIKWIKTKLI
jgi:hypothetical protein